MDFKAQKIYRTPAKPVNTDKTFVLSLKNMTAKDEEKINQVVAKFPGIEKAHVDRPNGKITVTYDPKLTSIFNVKSTLWENGLLARLATST